MNAQGLCTCCGEPVEENGKYVAGAGFFCMPCYEAEFLGPWDDQFEINSTEAKTGEMG